MSDSEFVKHIPCPKCGSSDANALYTDGHTHCFACSTTTPGDGSGVEPGRPTGERAEGLLDDVTVRGIPSRQISEETCRKFGYGMTVYRGKPVHVAPYYDENGKLIAQKVRFPDKSFIVRGDIKTALPFGAHVWPRTGRRIVVTEGEIDALTMSQVQGNSWPVVSIACGADKPVSDTGEELPMNKIRRYFGRHRDYFIGFDEVVLMFDSDEQGVASARVAAEIIGPTAKIATLPLKDPNDMLVNGRVKELIDAMWRAKKHSPDGIVSAKDLRAKVMQGIPKGVPWPWEALTALTHGIRLGEVYTIGAGTGVGKSHLLRQLLAHLIGTLKEPAGAIFLEENPEETLLRLLGIIDGKQYHLPEAWNPAEVEQALDRLDSEYAPLFLYDNFGAATWESIESRIRFLATAEGCKYIILDHLTALAAASDDERRALEQIMAELAALAKELNIALFVVSHLATPEGKPHEEGGRVMIRHFKGSRAIGFWSHYMLGLERNQQADDRSERLTTVVRLLKARYDGSKTGQCVSLMYDEDTGLLTEAGVGASADDHDFGSDSTPADEDHDF